MMHKNMILFYETLGLSLRYIFFEELQPIFFVMQDKTNLYLGLLCDDRGIFRWILSPVKTSVLFMMIDDSITIRSAFEKSILFGKSILAAKDKNSFSYKYVLFSEIAREDLPTKGEYFHADIEEKADFFKEFYPEIKACMTQFNQFQLKDAAALYCNVLLDRQESELKNRVIRQRRAVLL